MRPYPAELVEITDLPGIGRVRIRPVRPDDAPAFARAFERLSVEDRRMRFFSPMAELGDDTIAHLTRIDYDRHMAFVLERVEGPPELLGVARMYRDLADRTRAEFAVTVRTDLKRQGVGTVMLRRLIAHARDNGVRELYGDILAENTAMRGLAASLGFKIRPIPETSEILRAKLWL